MTTRQIHFFQFWRNQKERGALLRRVHDLRLDPSQLKQLLSDSEVRAKLQNATMASLLPPVGTEVFRRLTAASLEEIQQRQEADVVDKDPPKAAVHLEAGRRLPFVYRDPPTQLLNTPLEELDPFHQSQKTFIVVGKGNIIHRFNADSSFYLLSPLSLVRKAAISILIHSLFRLFIMVTILTNCVLLTVKNPPVWNGIAELVFISIYAVEVMVKVVARGFFVGRFTFLRDPCSWLDVTVVITGLLSLSVEGASVYALSALFRGLKLITVYPGMRRTAGAFIQSVKRLAGVVVLMVFGLSFLSLIGLQLFMGNLRNKCVVMPSPENLTELNLTAGHSNNTGTSEFDFQQYINNPEHNYYLPGEADALLCGNGSNAGFCPEGYSCLKAGQNPNYGFTSFDTFGGSMLSLFRLMTQDFWENLLQLVLRAAGKSNVLYFMFGFFPVCFCLVSLVLGKMAVVFVEQDEARVTEAKQKEEEFSQIIEALKKREEEEEQAAGGEPAPQKKSSAGGEPAPQKKSSAAETMIHTEESGQKQTTCSTCWETFANLFLKWNCCGCWRWFKRWLQVFVMNPFFDLVIVLLIILNTGLMAAEHYPMTPYFEYTTTLTGLVFTVIFIVEIILRILATDPYTYFKVDWNIYDFIIMTGSILDLFLEVVEGFSVMHIFIVLRILRLGRWWPTFHLWLRSIWTTVKALRNLTFLLFVMVFVSSIVALHLFSEDYELNVHRISPENTLPRWHMGGFFHAFLIVIRILCGEWIETMWDCMVVSGQTKCLIFYFVVLVIGNLLVLNLFLALLLSSFCGDYLLRDETRNNNVQIAINRIKAAVCGSRSWICRDKKVDSRKHMEGVALRVVTSGQNVGSSPVAIAEAEDEDEFKSPENEKEEVTKQQCDVQQEPRDERVKTPENCCWESCHRCCPFLDIDTSQGKGRVWSNFRRSCLLIEQHGCFEIFIIIIILLSSFALVFENIHLQHRPVLNTALDVADQVFAFLFLLEMLIKWTALGLKKYFSSFWCWLDFIILAVSLMAITAGMLGCTELGAGLTLKTVRTLRPLRSLSRFQGPRLVLRTLAGTLRSSANVLMMTLLVWLFFNIVGVNLFAGKFSYCYNETSEEVFHVVEVNNKSDCFVLPDARWKNPYINFDNMAVAYLALLQVATFKGWMDIMYSAVDSRYVEDQPAFEDNLYIYLYFITFIFFGCFFTFNIFTRVFIDALDLQKHKFGGKHVFMTKDQQKFSTAVKNLLTKAPVKPLPRPQNPCRRRLFDLVTHSYFEVFMVVLICLNMVCLMVEADDQSVETDMVLFWFYFVFLIIFFIEFLLKIIALGKNYFTSCWNILDFTVLVVTILGLFIADIAEKYFISPSMFPMLRLARVFRVLHLFRFTRGIQTLLLAFVMSLPALLNICFLLFVLMFTYSIFGTLNFAFIKREAMIDDMINFETFGSSIICMFVITTRAGWDAVLIPFLNAPPDCDPDIENPGFTVRGNCASPAVGIIFCTSYILLSLLLLLHLYIAIILETFSTDDKQLSDDDLHMFYKTWRKFDPSASQLIQHSQLSDLCDSLQAPLKIPKPNTITLTHMDLPQYPGDKLHCLDVLTAVTGEVFGEPGERDTLKAIMEEMFRNNSLSKDSYEPGSSAPQGEEEEAAALVIQRAYRKHRQDTDGVVADVNGSSGV